MTQEKITENTIFRTISLCCTMLLGFMLFQSCTVEAVEKVFDELEELAETEEGIVKLKGDWLRVSSSNANNDGMIIRVLENSGKITTNANSSFAVGDIKWKNIDVVDQENYIHEELGSDGSYYNANMELRNDDTLRIKIQVSGSGNLQKWVRN